MSAARYSRARWLLPREDGKARSESGRERKRVRRKDPSRPEAMAPLQPSPGLTQGIGGASSTRSGTCMHRVEERSRAVAAKGHTGRGAQCTDGQRGRATKVSNYR